METPPITAVREHALDPGQPPIQGLALLHARWQEVRDGRACPVGPVEDFLGHDIKGLVGKVNVVDVEPRRGEFRFRLLGKRNHRILRDIVPGAAVTEIPVASYRDMLLRHYGAVVRQARPTLHRIELDSEARRSHYTRLILPLSADGTAVTTLVSVTLCDASKRKSDDRARLVLAERAALIPAEIPRLRRYALQLTRNPADADDLVQDSIERALSQLHMLVPGYALRPWLFTVMHNTFISQTRRDGRLQLVEPSSLPEQAGEADPGFEQQCLRRDIDRSLSALSPHQKQVVELVLFNGLSYQSAADRLAIPIGTVMSRLARGREKLRELLAA